MILMKSTILASLKRPILKNLFWMKACREYSNKFWMKSTTLHLPEGRTEGKMFF